MNDLTLFEIILFIVAVSTVNTLVITSILK